MNNITKDNIVLFVKNWDDFINVCLGLDGGFEFDFIRKQKQELRIKLGKISEDEYFKEEAEIFYQYLQFIKAI